LNGNGEVVWGRKFSTQPLFVQPCLFFLLRADSELTSIGIDQARTVHENWLSEAKFGLPPPHIRYCSPLTRALHTASITFDGTYERYPSRVIVKENCREEHGVHTCDKRNSVSYITSRFPEFEVEADMTEEDRLWKETVRETPAEVVVRAKMILDDVFEKCGSSDTFISVTAHCGFISGFLTAIGRPDVVLPTGGVLPVVVKAERI